MGFGALATPIIQALQRRGQQRRYPMDGNPTPYEAAPAGGGGFGQFASPYEGEMAYAGGRDDVTPIPAPTATPMNTAPIPATPAPSGFGGMNPAYAQYLQPTPEETNLRQLIRQGAPQGQRGFKARAGAFLRGLQVGGLPTAVYSAFDPDLLNRAIHNQITLPQAQHLAQLSGQMNNQRLQRLMQVQQADESRRYHDARIQNMRTDNDLAQKQFGFGQWKEQQAQAEKQRDNQRADATALSNQQYNLTKEGGQYGRGMAELFTPRATNRGNLIPALNGQGFFRMPSVEQEQDRKLALEREKGKAELDLAVRKERILAPEKLDTFEEQERIRQKYNPPKDSPETKEAKQRRDEAFKVYTRLKATRERAAQLDEESKHIVDPEKRLQKEGQAQGEWDTVRREIEVARQQYPEHINGYEGDGGYPHLEGFKELAAGTTSPARGSLSTQSGNYKAGDVVRYKGQRHRILRFENGQPVLDPKPIQ